MGPLELAAARTRERQAIARTTARAILQLWRRVDRDRIGLSWSALVAAAVQGVSRGQVLAATGADAYLDRLDTAYDVSGQAAGRVRAGALAGVASDGRELAGLLYQPAVTALTAIRDGATVSRAMAAGSFAADMIARTQVADAGRAADAVALATRHHMSGYVRVVSLPACSRCILLAGRHYRWNAGFRRHPRCDCVHLPVPSASAADPLVTNPRAAFEHMSRAEQDWVFTSAGAEAIRQGADIGRVVNARRKAAGLAPAGARLTEQELAALRGGRERGSLAARRIGGVDVFATAEGGRRVRLMPESIFQAAGDDRDEAIRLLRVHGYLI